MAIVGNVPYRQAIGEGMLPGGVPVLVFVTRPWQEFLRDLLERVGGPTGPAIADLEGESLFAEGGGAHVSSLAARVAAVEAAELFAPAPVVLVAASEGFEGATVALVATLQARIADLELEALFTG